MPADRDLDMILDEALVSYSNAEPDPLLRARIMARAEQAAPRPKRVLWPAGIALSAAALLIAFLLHPTTPMPKQKLAPPSIASAPPPQIAAPAPKVSVAHRYTRPGRQRNLAQARIIAHRDVFPSPAPLTADEMALLHLAREHPRQARQVLAAPAWGPIETAPVAIAPIRIAALSEPQDQKALP